MPLEHGAAAKASTVLLDTITGAFNPYGVLGFVGIGTSVTSAPLGSLTGLCCPRLNVRCQVGFRLKASAAGRPCVSVTLIGLG